VTPTRDEPPVRPGPRDPGQEADPDAELDFSLAAMLRPGSKDAPVTPDAIVALERSVTERVASEQGLLGWFASRPTPVRIALCAAAIIAPALAQLALRQRSDLRVYPVALLVVQIALVTFPIVGVLATLLRPLHRTALSNRASILILIGALVAPVLASLVPACADLGSLPVRGFWLDAGACFTYGLLLAIPVLAILFAADRQRHEARRLALTAAGLGGLCANLALVLHCPINQLSHLLAGHASVSGFLVVVYVMLHSALLPAARA
jgi:hypothetical protein